MTERCTSTRQPESPEGANNGVGDYLKRPRRVSSVDDSSMASARSRLSSEKIAPEVIAFASVDQRSAISGVAP